MLMVLCSPAVEIFTTSGTAVNVIPVVSTGGTILPSELKSKIIFCTITIPFDSLVNSNVAFVPFGGKTSGEIYLNIA